LSATGAGWGSCMRERDEDPIGPDCTNIKLLFFWVRGYKAS
jgi:hypothetical protein